MFRFLVFLLLVLSLGLLFAWVSDNPGMIFLQWEWLAAQMGSPGEEVGIPLTLGFAILVGLIFTIMVIWGILRSIIFAPSLISKYFDNRKREKGYKALSQGLIAASSGDASTARKLTKESKKLLGSDPLVALLGTQTAILEGKRDEARENFKAMLTDDSTRMVALRGLFMEAERQGEPEAALHYAQEASKTDSSLPWAGNAKLRYAAMEGDWDTAIRALDSNRSAGLVTKPEATHLKAVLLTGKALSKEAEEPQYAATLSKQAHKLGKDFVPAAVTYARVATRNGDVRAASKVIEATWKKTPHPELAQAYEDVRSGDSVQDRLKRAQKLSKLAPDHPESGMAVATAAIAASNWELARSALEPILTTKPTERACLLMADIEEGEHGDKGRMRDWLSRAVRAERDPTWVAGTHISDTWLPISPVTGDLDAFEWKVPVQQLGDNAAKVMTLEELKAESSPLEVEEIEEVIEAEIVEANDEVSSENSASKQDETPIPATVVVSASAAAGAAVSDAVADDATKETSEEIKVDVIKEAEVEVAENKPAKETTSKEAVPEPQNDNKSDASKEEDSEEKSTSLKDADSKADNGMPNKLAAEPSNSESKVNSENAVEFPLKRRPDDPGPHPDKEPPKKGFKLF